MTLFPLKINSIVRAISPGVECSLYVDDFRIVYRSKYIHIIERHLQRSLSMLSHWADTNGFKFSSSKTVCMHFCRLRSAHPNPELTLNGSLLSSFLLNKPNSSESFLTTSSHSFHTFVTSKKSVWRRWTFCVLLLTLIGEPTSTRCYIFVDRLFVLSSTMAVLSMVLRENLTYVYVGSDTEPCIATMHRCLQNLTCLKYVCSSQWTSALHTAKNAEYTVFHQNWLIPEQSSLQYGLQPKIKSFLLFKT